MPCVVSQLFGAAVGLPPTPPSEPMLTPTLLAHEIDEAVVVQVE